MMNPGSPYRTLIDHVTDGQIEWVQMPNDFDFIKIGAKTQFNQSKGMENWRASLERQFPDELTAIDK